MLQDVAVIVSIIMFVLGIISVLKSKRIKDKKEEPIVCIDELIADLEEALVKKRKALKTKKGNIENESE